MFTEKDILTRLQNGESVEAIANEVAELLNKANSTYEAEVEAQKAKEAELKAQKENEKAKIDDMQDIIDLIAVWANKYYGVEAEVFDTISAEEIIGLIDECKAYLKSLDNLVKSFDISNPFACQKAKTPKKPAATMVIDADKKLADFISKMGW